MTLYLGAPMWGLKLWVGNFFPVKAKPRDFLSLYSRRLNTVEGNTTFYALPKGSSVERWAKETPEGFHFCFKFPKKISHEKRLRDVQDEVSLFFKVMSPIESRVGPFFLQLPPSFSITSLPLLEAFFQQLPSDFKYAVEVRHPSFFDEAEGEQRFHDLLRRQRVNLVSFDTQELHSAGTDDLATLEAQQRKPKAPLRSIATATSPLVRFVGHPDNARNLPALERWAKIVNQWIIQGHTPYIFLHTPDDVYAPQLARDFHRLLCVHAPKVGTVPPWPGESLSRDGSQQQLPLFL